MASQTVQRFKSSFHPALLKYNRSFSALHSSPTRVRQIILKNDSLQPWPFLRSPPEETSLFVKLSNDIRNIGAEASVYEKLSEFQGKSLPLFFGRHEVVTDYGHTLVLITENLPLSLGDMNLKQRLPFDSYTCMFRSALELLLTAHKHEIFHSAITDTAMRVVGDRLVLVNWQNDPTIWHDHANRTFLQARYDISRLVVRFLANDVHEDRFWQYLKGETEIWDTLKKYNFLQELARYWR